MPEDNISCSYDELALLFPENRGQQTLEVEIVADFLISFPKRHML